MTAFRARDDRGHYLPTGAEPYTLDPEAWDDTCRHQSKPTDLKPSAETFGHEPRIGFVDGRALNRVCARCYTTDPNGPRFFGTRKVAVRWPCTSAVVLGLVAA